MFAWWSWAARRGTSRTMVTNRGLALCCATFRFRHTSRAKPSTATLLNRYSGARPPVPARPRADRLGERGRHGVGDRCERQAIEAAGAVALRAAIAEPAGVAGGAGDELGRPEAVARGQAAVDVGEEAGAAVRVAGVSGEE